MKERGRLWKLRSQYPSVLKKVVPRDFMGTKLSVLPCLVVLVPHVQTGWAPSHEDVVPVVTTYLMLHNPCWVLLLSILL